MFGKIIESCKSYVSGQIGLIVLGQWVQEKSILSTISSYVSINQKTITHRPIDKLTDLLAMLLTGEKSLSVANERLKSDKGVQQAFGRSDCADQSTIQATLNSCTPENVSQMEAALKAIYQNHSCGYRHNYEQSWQVLDIDLNGRPCGPKAEFATQGYFAKQRGRSGHQLGRVYATQYQEIVIDRLYPGNTTLPTVLLELVERATDVLDLARWQRERTLLRIDGHGGSQANVNALLKQGYQLLTKEYSTKRARSLAQSVTDWVDDPKVVGRQAGWVTTPADEYDRPIHRIAVRSRKKNGQWGIGVLLTTLEPDQACFLAGYPPERVDYPADCLMTYLHLYDLRGGGVESSFNHDNQPVGFSKRAKKRFTAQQMLILFNLLAHNLLVWFQLDLAYCWADLANLGRAAFFRKLTLLTGIALFEQVSGRLTILRLNTDGKFAQQMLATLQAFWIHADICIVSPQ